MLERIMISEESACVNVCVYIDLVDKMATVVF